MWKTIFTKRFPTKQIEWEKILIQYNLIASNVQFIQKQILNYVVFHTLMEINFNLTFTYKKQTGIKIANQ